MAAAKIEDDMGDNEPGYGGLAGWLFGAVALWLCFGVAVYILPSIGLHSEMATAGQFGDMFGSVNALFSGMAFAGIIYTIGLQRRELKLQRQELAATRAELKRTAEAQEKAEQALREQAHAAAYGHQLSTINHLLRYADECQDRLLSGKHNSKDLERLAHWASRRTEFAEDLETVYRTLRDSNSPFNKIFT